MDGLRLKPYEEAALLNHYGLDTLQPQVWTDAPETPPNGPGRQPSKWSLSAAQGSEQETADWQYDDADPLGIRESILGRRAVTMQPGEFENGIFVSHKQFDPELFLAKVHQNTSYKDLVAGARRLRDTVDQNADQLKELVRENLDRFVGAKNTVDTIYAEMKAKNLNPEELYGTRRFTEELIALTNDANRIFAPIIERRARAERVRVTLSVLERFRFFFNLPRSLIESIKQNKFDVAVRDYKKGKSLRNLTTGAVTDVSTPPGVSPSPASASSFLVEKPAASPGPAAPAPGGMTLPPLQQKVSEKVWSAVEEAVVELRANLFRQLECPWVALDIQERNIGYLLELDTASDPAWFYIESQFKWIDNLLRSAHAEHAIRATTLHDQLQRDRDKKSSQHKSALTNKAISLLSSNDFELVFAKDKEVQMWRSILKSVRMLSHILLQALPDFWKLSRSYAEGKFQKVRAPLDGNVVNLLFSRSHSSDPRKSLAITLLLQYVPSATSGDLRKRRVSVDRRRGERSLSMAKQLLELYADLLSSTLSLPRASDNGARPPMISIMPDETLSDSLGRGVTKRTGRPGAGYGEPVTPAPGLPPGSSSVVTCHFLTRIVADLSHCFNDIKSAKLAPEVVSVMSSLMEKCRWTFIDIICRSWVDDAQTFYVHEDWTADPDNGELTSLLKLFHRFQKYNARATYRIANTVVTLGDEKEERRNMALPPSHMDRIRNAFFGSINHLLDALHHLVFSEHAELSTAAREQPRFVKENADVSKMECRILITLSNLVHLKTKAIPRLVSMFEAAFKTAMNAEVQELNEVIDHLDGLLFNEYVKRKNAPISEIIENGFLFGGIDWATISKPTEVHPFIYEALLAMVLVHAEVSDLSPSLVPRVISALLENFAQDTLEAVRIIHKFGLGGMLQATLEVEFVHQVLARFVTPLAGSLLQLVYSTIESSVHPEDRARDGRSISLQEELETVKELLAVCRKATGVQFLCFAA